MKQITEISESFVVLKNELIISDIDLALHVIGLIDRHQFNFSGRTFRFKNSYRFYALLFWIFFNAIRYIFFLLVSEDGKVPISYLDSVQYIGGITQFHRLEILCGLISTFVILLHFTFSSDIQWLEIIGILKGLQPMDGIKSLESSSVRQFVNKVRFMKNVIKIANLITILSLTLAIILVTLNSVDLTNILKYGILSILMLIILFSAASLVFTYSFLYYYIVCEYCKMKFNLLNGLLKSVGSDKLFIEYKTITEILEQHNNIFNKISSYNKFWKIYYFTINYTLIPLDLLLLQQILFEESDIPIYFASIAVFIQCLGLHFILNSIIASVNKESSKSHKSLYSFALKLISLLNIKHKIKVFILNLIK